MARAAIVEHGGKTAPAPARFSTVALAKRLAAACDDLEFDDRRLAQAVDLAQPLGPRGNDFGEGAEAREQRLGERLDVAARDGAKQHQFEQFVIGQRLGAGLAEAVAQPLAMAEIMRRASASSAGGRRLRHARGSRRSVGRMVQPFGDSVKISQPVSVTPIVCSNCADSERSRVTAVQPSDRIFTCGRPRLIIGSMVKNMPGFSTTPSPRRP